MHVFKKPGKHKGILVATHKEADWFSKQSETRKVMHELSKEYCIGIHYGWYGSYQGQSYQSFIMAPKTTAQVSGGKIRIPMNSRNFLPTYLQPDESVSKVWDVINISRNAKAKHLPEFLKSIKKIYDSGRMLKVLLVCPKAGNETSKGHDVNIVKMYQEMFSPKEREYFTMMRLSSELDFLGISQKTIADFYRMSKVFCLFTDLEGESRVIHEALLCGLPVVVYKRLMGGGRDHLNGKNSMLFSDYSDAHETIKSAVDGYDSGMFPTDESLISELREDHTVPLLLGHLSNVVACGDDMEVKGSIINLDNLHMRLPAHYMDVPWAHGGGITADIKSMGQFETFKKEVV
jgi:hypothetical protein